MYRSTLSEIWCNILFKAVSVPFVVLLAVLVAKQTISLRHYSATLEPTGTGSAAELMGETVF
ncbi:MAG: hypothetical protein WA885_02495 [Phormidesmis sp.]